MNKIAVIAAYFGKLPNYFPLWMKSCAKNPTIDFFVVTDQDIQPLSPNIIIKSMTLEDMRRRASAALGFEAALSRPYKCCDYKPAYGLIFSDFLQQYDYWGHCDVDLIFGDLQHFFDEYDLYSYDKFGTLGHLSLYRNTEEMNLSFKTVCENLDYRKVYSVDDSCLFDELSGIYRIHKHQQRKLFSKRIFIDIATTFKRYRPIAVYKLDVPPVNYPAQSFMWENGKVYHVFENKGKIEKKEYIYVHFQKRPNYPLTFSSEDADAFYITNSGFHVKDAEPTRETLLKMNPYPGAIHEFMEYHYNCLSRRIKNRIRMILGKSNK